MDILIALLIAALGGVFYFKKKADESAIDAKLGKTKGQDLELKKEQMTLKEAIKQIDENIKKLRESKTSQKDKTLAEVKEDLKNKLK